MVEPVDKRPGLVRPRDGTRFITTNEGLYRIRLERSWGTHQRTAVCIGLNPSTADHTRDDPTIKAMYQHCDAWDRERLIMINLFTLVATDPPDMKKHPTPEVNGSLEVWQELFAKPEPGLLVVAAWGAHGIHQDQDRQAMKWLRHWGIKPMCLVINADGTPKHPLYVTRGTPLKEYSGR